MDCADDWDGPSELRASPQQFQQDQTFDRQKCTMDFSIYSCKVHNRMQ